MKRRYSFVMVIVLLALNGCTQFPELEGTIRPEAQNSPYPKLVPINPLLRAGAPSATDPVATEAALTQRLAGLRARADRLRGSVLSGRERQRLKNGLR